MRVRPLGTDGDFVPVYSLSQMASGSDAVRQVVDLRLRLNRGEWWEDEEIGFQVPEFLTESARSGDVDLLSKYISMYISQTMGVRAIEDVLATISGHDMAYTCVVLTDDGTSETVEVNINGLL